MISKVDKNFTVETKIEREVEFHNIEEDCFSIFGVFKENGRYVRLPEETAKSVSEGVAYLNNHTSGGRVAFKTNSSFVAVNLQLNSVDKGPHAPVTGNVGLDMYIKGEIYDYVCTFIPPFEVCEGFESIFDFGSSAPREIIINFPSYSGISEFNIGVEPGSSIEEDNPYCDNKRVVFYGSSITQGGCASRPGNTYSSVLSRKFGFDYLNLGFSGSALGEDVIAEYISCLEMSLFIYDYDHNAPNAAHLRETHERMFKIIREKNPNLPIVILSRPSGYHSPNDERKSVIKNTYENALKNGDRNVYFIDGEEIFNSIDRNMMTVDGCHPNDFGFWCMSEAIGAVIKNIL